MISVKTAAEFSVHSDSKTLGEDSHKNAGQKGFRGG